MAYRIKLWGLVFTILLASIRVYSQTTLSAKDAKNHIGEIATVCGHVMSAHYAVGSRGRPTFLNFDEPYPRQVFTVLIWGNDRAKFGQPEETYRDKDVCATGQIQSYRGGAEIIARAPGELSLRGEPKQRKSHSESTTAPPGATAQCRDGSYSYSRHRRGTCSHHGGVAKWLQ